jgi:RecJ-like exonuclease
MPSKDCYWCHGSGKVEQRCPTCRGSGRLVDVVAAIIQRSEEQDRAGNHLSAHQLRWAAQVVQQGIPAEVPHE